MWKGDWEDCGDHRHQLIQTGYSHARYGPCEVCAGQPADVTMQKTEVLIRSERGDFWTRAKSLWGHEHCLIGERDRIVAEARA